MSALVLYLHFGDEWHQFASTEQIQGEGLIVSSQYSNQEMLIFLSIFFWEEMKSSAERSV